MISRTAKSKASTMSSNGNSKWEDNMTFKFDLLFTCGIRIANLFLSSEAKHLARSI